ncbi:S-adenosyl-L-methionine-dependent methyltransferase [Mycena filopes]|nr:S-adenosyl-L-methionine-dependent methyltransferase [Mycena filopes]
MARMLDADHDSDNDSIASLPPFSAAGTTSGSRTSHDVSMRSASPTPSVLSMTSSMRTQAFKQEYGRKLNNYSELYRLPADDEELDRLNKQHEMFIEIMGKYPPCLPDIMRNDVPGETKACLDLGCGSGAWIIELAREFPRSVIVGVDLAPMQSLTMPDNCRSEVDDINLGLEHFYGDFNVVHARLISSGIRDFPNLIDQISHVVRPAGLLIMMEFDFFVYKHMPDGNHRRLDLDTTVVEQPWLARWMSYAHVAVRNAGGDPDAATYLHRWLTSQPAFENAVYEDYWVPVSPHPDFDEVQQRIGAQMRDDILSFLKSGRPLLLGSGIPEPIVDELQVNAERELISSSCAQYIRCQSVYCRKKVS